MSRIVIMLSSRHIKYIILLLMTALPLLATPDIAEAAQNGTKLGLVPNPSTRGTLEIVTASLLTIIACTWSVLHLNVPALGDSILTKTMRRLKWTLITIVFPEMIFVNAMEEWLLARYFMKQMTNLEERGTIASEEEFLGSNRIVTRWTVANGKKPTTPDDAFVHKRNIWTLTHSYYANMGGIRIMTRDPSNPKYYELYILDGDYLISTDFDPVYHPLKWLAITEDEILDKSKSESFAKAIASLQFAYLVLSAISRAVRRLGLAQLEIFVLASAVLAILNYVSYWNKPQNVDVPTTIFMPKFSNDVERDLEIRKSLEAWLGDHDRRIIPCKEEWIIDHSRTADYVNHGLDTTEKWMHSRSLVKMVSKGRVDNFDPLGTVGWGHGKTIIAISGLVIFIFGGIHLLAWNFDFPTAAERIIWRSSSVAILVVPFVSVGLIWTHLDVYGVFLSTLNDILLYFFIAIYIIARLAIITIAFTSLREMPADVYITTWATYLPSVQ